MPPVRAPAGRFSDHSSHAQAYARRSEDKSPPDLQNAGLIVAVVLVCVCLFAFILYLLLRCVRRRSETPPFFVPALLHARWKRWRPGMYTSPPRTPRLPSTRSSRRNARAGGIAAGLPSRVASIRSIMTLPEYRPVAASDRERTIGREGERAGIDVVLEFPETVEEEESRREDHMQSLYEIRLARQLERAAARESGSPVPPITSTTALMAALQNAQERERRLSQVSYAEVGVHRPDGTRVRPSMESERPLLDASRASLASRHESIERRASEEIMGLGTGLGERVPLNVDPGARTPEYEGLEWGPPPEYTSPVEARNAGVEMLPVLRVVEGTPVGSRSTTPAPPQSTTTTTATAGLATLESSSSPPTTVQLVPQGLEPEPAVPALQLPSPPVPAASRG